MGEQAWNNHHPFAYTLLIKVCLGIAHHLGFSTTTGCALYSIVQMSFMAICFGYLSRWIVTRTRINAFWGIVIVIGLSCTPYIATYSIAMWKDPLFSVAIIMITLLLMDLALTKGRVVKNRRSWIPAFCTSLSAAILLRSNGLYVAAFTFLALLIFTISVGTRNCRRYILPLVSCGLTIILCVGITGPGYKALNVQEAPRVERVGIFLNQMARVAATDGEMTEQDREYMNQLLPLELYASVYTPCCTDMLKWDQRFNAAPLESDFFSHWLSIGVRNPLAYFEAWELQTCGFWAVNQPYINSNQSNINSGVPRNIHPEHDGGNIEYENKFANQTMRNVLLLDEWCIPAGLLNWIIFYLAICIALLHHPRWLLGLIPTIGLVLTLLIATPIWYWSRYEAAAYFLIPFYAALVLLLIRHNVAGRSVVPKDALPTGAGAPCRNNPTPTHASAAYLENKSFRDG